MDDINGVGNLSFVNGSPTFFGGQSGIDTEVVGLCAATIIIIAGTKPTIFHMTFYRRSQQPFPISSRVSRTSS